MTMEPRCDQFRSEVSAPAGAQLRVIERQMHVDAIANIDREADREVPRREVEIEQLRAAYTALKRQAREAGERLKEAVVRDAAAKVAYSQVRATHEGALLKTGDAAIAEFMASLNVERDLAMEACRRREKPDFAAVNARIAAINDAVEQAGAMLFRPDQAGVREQLAMLRSGLPPADAQTTVAECRAAAGE